MSRDLQTFQATEQTLVRERERLNAALARLGSGRGDGGHAVLTASAAPPPARLVFILDLTSSRKPGLDQARVATAAMFETVKQIGAIEVKLIYYRGCNECRSTDWQTDPEVISRTMRSLSCKAGETQIARALAAVVNRPDERVTGVVFIGDECEEGEPGLVLLATELGHQHIPVFVFHECADGNESSLDAAPVFERIAAASGGVYCAFDPGSAAQLRELLSTVAAFSAAGNAGVKGIEPAATPEARQLQARLLLGPAPPSPAAKKAKK